MWRKKIDKSLKPYLEKFIAETHFQKEALKTANDPSKAQLWIAIALLSRQLYNMEMKLKYLEKAMQDISQVKESEKFLQDIEKQIKQPRTEKEKIEPEIETFEIKEAKALGNGASLLSEIAKKGKNKAKKKKK